MWLINNQKSFFVQVFWKTKLFLELFSPLPCRFLHPSRIMNTNCVFFLYEYHFIYPSPVHDMISCATMYAIYVCYYTMLCMLYVF